MPSIQEFLKKKGVGKQTPQQTSQQEERSLKQTLFGQRPEDYKARAQGLFNFGKSVLQETARSGGSIGLEFTDTDRLAPGDGTLGQIQQFIFGEEPLESLSVRINKAPERTTEFLRGFGVEDQNIVNKQTAPFAILGLTALDFLPGGGKKKFFQTLSKLDNADAVKSFLKGSKFTDDVIEETAPQIAKLKKPKEIEQLLDRTVKALDAQTVKQTAPKTVPKIAKDGRVVPQKFRADKLDLSPEVQEQVVKRLDALGLSKRRVRTFGQMRKNALELGYKNVDTFLKDVKQNRITDNEVVALRDFISRKADEVVQLEEQIRRQPANSAVLSTRLSKATDNLNQSIKKLVRGGTEAGRAVVAFRIQANKTLDPGFWLAKASKLAGRNLNVDEVTAINRLIDQRNQEGLVQFVSMMRTADKAEKAVTLWKAGLLTSPTTQLANIGGNITMGVLMTASDVVSTGLDVLAAFATGKRTTTISPATVAAKTRGFVKGTKDAKKFLRTGVYSQDLLTKYDITRQVNFEHKILDTYTKTIFRALGAGDILFRQAALEESLEKSARVIAKNEGLAGVAFKRRVGKLLTRPTNEMVANAIDAAEYATFQKPNALASLIQGGKRSTTKEVRVGAELVAPFTRTPANIADAIVEFSPAGIVRAFYRYARPSTANQKALVESLGRGITGTGLIAFGAYLSQKGLLTGNPPTNPSERADFFAEGKQAHSLKVGEYWLRLDRLSPFGNLLALGADFHESGTEAEGLSRITQTSLEGLKGLVDQTFLRGIAGAIGAIYRPEREGQNFLEQTVGSFVPSIIGRTTRVIDPTLRTPEGVIEALRTRIPLLQKGVPPVRDIFGNKVITPGGRLNPIDPFQSSKVKNNPIVEEAKRIGVVVGLPSRNISGERLSNEEYSEYQRIQGKVLEAVLSQVINSQQYQSGTTQDKVDMFETVKREVRSRVNDSVFPALMIEKYNLPTNTHPQILRHLLTELNSRDEFKKKNDDERSQILLRIINQIQ